MKKRLLALSMAAIMVAGSLTACGETPAQPANPAGGETPATTEGGEAAPEITVTEGADITGEEEGKVLNIACWNDEFARRLRDHYPGFVANDPEDATKGGHIGDIEVKFIVTPSDNNAYQNALDQDLPNNETAAADDRIDLVLVEADYALKYVNTPYTLPVTDLGINISELSNQYKYTQDVMTSSEGTLKGVSWQGCPGVLIYNREAATAILGSDDPATVQDAVKDWDAFQATAALAANNGYKMTATVNDTFRVFSNNMTSPWVVDGKIVIDKNIQTWVDLSKAMVDAKQTTTYDLWSNEWNSGYWPKGGTATYTDENGEVKEMAAANKLDVFCYFGPAWLINFCMKADDPTSIAAQGGWGAVEGPMGFYWGGTWIAAAAGTDNKATIADIMRQLTVEESVMTAIVKDDSDFVNNKPAMEAASTDDAYGFPILGGQNPLAMFCAGAEKIDLSNMSAYDQGIIESFQKYMKEYFDGTVDYDTALANFYADVETKYPELTH